jgi:predicted flap endonuclease-1-like 5' DNA nuclease
MSKLTDIEGVGDSYAEKLQAAGIKTANDLLEKGATPQGRKELMEKSGIGESQINRWINHADLFRVKGIGGEYAELLEAAGVDTVPELAQRNAENLATKLAEVNEQKKLVRSVPSAKVVTDWVDQAKSLPRKINY